MRVLVTGMGGDLGTRVAQLLEDEPSVEVLVGMGVDPPRRRLRAAQFHRVDPRDRRRVVRIVQEVEPTHIVHLGVYEPDARSAPRIAEERTAAGTLTVLGQAAEGGSLERIVLRSGIEVYGRRRRGATVPDEAVPPDPSSHFGRILSDAERTADAAAQAADVPIVALRYATLAGSHFPSPLGRLLRLPVVPFAALGDPPFSLLHPHDAARAAVAALLAEDVDGPVNVVAPGAVTVAQAARLGGRIPVPIAGPGWAVAAAACELSGTPMPEHVLELLRRGRAADGHRCAEVLGMRPEQTTLDIVKDLYDWAPVTPLRLAAEDAA